MSKRFTARFLRLTLPALVLSLGMTGCESEDPTLTPAGPLLPKAEGEIPDVAAPDSGPGWAFFPLQQGNRWEYARQFQAQLTPDGGEPQEPMLVEARIESQIAGTEVRDGVTYEILEQHWDEEGDTFTQWLRLRQDKSGLYEADVLVSEPPMTSLVVRSQTSRDNRWNRLRQAIETQVAEEGLDPGFLRALDAIQERHERIRQLLAGKARSAPTPSKASRRGGPQENELVRLAYPLHSKASWTVREEPMGTATVEGRDVLHLPAGKMPAWRIGLHWDFLEPDDRVSLWYGRCGMLQFEAHTVVVATDEEGQRIGTIVADESEVLLDLDVQRGGCR